MLTNFVHVSILSVAVDQCGYITEPKTFQLRWHPDIHITLIWLKPEYFHRCFTIRTAVSIVKVNCFRQICVECTIPTNIFFTKSKLRTTSTSILPRLDVKGTNLRTTQHVTNILQILLLPSFCEQRECKNLKDQVKSIQYFWPPIIADPKYWYRRNGCTQMSYISVTLWSFKITPWNGWRLFLYSGWW